MIGLGKLGKYLCYLICGSNQLSVTKAVDRSRTLPSDRTKEVVGMLDDILLVAFLWAACFCSRAAGRGLPGVEQFACASISIVYCIVSLFITLWTTATSTENQTWETMIIIDKYKWFKNLVYLLFPATRSGLQYTITKAIRDSWDVIFMVLWGKAKSCALSAAFPGKASATLSENKS